jgi:hypothetical protein
MHVAQLGSVFPLQLKILRFFMIKYMCVAQLGGFSFVIEDTMMD